MTPAVLRRGTAVFLLLSALVHLLTGCWDNQEIEDQFILTGLAIDTSDTPGQVIITAQVADIKQGEAGSGDAGKEGGDATLIMKVKGDSLMDCLTEMDRNSGHKLLFNHNQIRLFGIGLAQQGILKYLDMIMRDQKARLEVPVAVVEGRGEEALDAELSHTPISGMFLGEMFADQSEVSAQYRVRLLDFVQRLLDDAAAPVMPIIEVTMGEGDSHQIKMAGMAVFTGGKMTGRLTNDETIGYILSFGNVKKCNIDVTDGYDRAGLHIVTLDCKREVTLRADGGVRVSLIINSVVNIAEIYGFKDMKPPELLKHLEKLAQDEIKDKIINCFSVAKSLDADIFGFCTSVYKKYPRQWNGMKERWSKIFSDIDLQVHVKVRIPGTGQIVRSLEMEEGKSEN